MLSVAGKKILVLGLARSGLAAARLLWEGGARVTGSDLKPLDDLSPEVQRLRDLGIKIETGGHTDGALRGADFIVVSPGIPENAPILVGARESQIPLYGELEVASWWARAPLVVVTGSNGKTTTTTLIGNIFKRADWPYQVAGNIGFPLSGCVKEVPAEGVIVVEASSFQLEQIETFRPHVGVVLNITQDHLDRHGSMEAYTRAKSRLLMNQQSGDCAVLNLDDPRTAALQAESRGRVVFYSLRQEPQGGIFVRDGCIISQVTDAEQKILEVQKVGIPGPHNLSNCLAAVAAAQIMGVDSSICARELIYFRGIEHRLELVRVLNGVKYVNDSKATNVDAVEQALLTFTEPIVLIAGGRDKNANFQSLGQLIKRRVRLLLLLGEARDKMHAIWGDKTETILVKDLEEAVHLARRRTVPGDCVLLSPACASFDMFRDFEHRGKAFKEIVKSLEAGKEGKSSNT